MRLFQSLSFRLALTYVGLFCASVSVLLALYYWLSIQGPLDEVRAFVADEAAEMSGIYAAGGMEALKTALEVRADRPGVRKAFHALFDKAGVLVSANLPSWPQGSSLGWIEIEADVHHDGDETDHNALTLDYALPGGARILIGRDTEDIQDLEEQLSETAAWILGCALLLGIAGGVLMSRSIHARLDSINTAARNVMSGDLSRRMEVRGSGDDFDRLAETLNLMLQRIEELFEAVRRVSDTVAHELRLPLTRLLVRLDGLRADSPGSPALAESIREALSEGHRLQRIFDALLRIARIESGRHVAADAAVDVSRLIADVSEFYMPDAESRSITLSTSIGTAHSIKGDSDLLFQAIANLIDNALKYTPAGGAVEVGIAEPGGVGGVTVFVSDNGQGVGSADLARLTERFFRGASSAGMRGEGLGLSLVAAVAGRHRAELRFLDNNPGLRVELAFANAIT